MNIFVCYATEDSRFARRLIDLLRNNHYSPVTMSMYSDTAVWQQDIQASPVFLLIYSYALKDSHISQHQWEYAISQNKPMLMLKVDDAVTPDALQQTRQVDYLDFIEIARQVADGTPGLRHEQYAGNVSLKMMMAELAALREELAASDAFATQQIPKLREFEDADTKKLTGTPEEMSRLKKITDRLRRLSGNGEENN